MTERTIHLIFKTHLDIGFTDHAQRVRRQYHEQFIPQALDTAEHFYAEDPDHPKFIWTTGAWLIWDHLQSQDADRVQRLERAIQRGLIRWHALPFTTHTELMTPALFEAGLSFGQELDARFGVKTIAAKMTDVPGHTLGMVPLMAKAGIRFLHLGVNTASPVPDVPELFRWQAPDGSEVLVMYQKSYGETDFPADPNVGLSFAHTNDNVGPQSIAQTVEAYRGMTHHYPGTRIMASTLDAFAGPLWERRAEFPVVTTEIGDSWIHGAASDPIKLARFRALSRVHDALVADGTSPSRKAFGRGLTLVAEHTWGVDIKTYLRDETAWDRADFDKMRQTDYRFAHSEKSWAEQRAYLDAAVTELDAADRALADAALAELEPPPRPIDGHEGTVLTDGGWTVTLDRHSGDILSIVGPEGGELQGAPGLMGYRHESYDSTELARHLDSYLQHRDEWAILDHDKPGLAKARTARTAGFETRLRGVDGATAILDLDAEAHRDLGAPETVKLTVSALDTYRLRVAYVLRNKPANRMPEAGFVRFSPLATGDWRFEKLGLLIDPTTTARRGGGQLQAVTAVTALVAGGPLAIRPLDCALVAPDGTDFMPFAEAAPRYPTGVRFNAYNNKWGTNFPMWWEGDLALRFDLELAPGQAAVS
jgi:hypothetical protein